MQTRYTCMARSLINNYILKEAPAPLAGGILVALCTTQRCKNPRYPKFISHMTRKAPSFRVSVDVKFHCCYFENSVSTAAQWLSGAGRTTFGTPQYGADNDDLRVHPP
jgi:hypothetical protein